MTTTNIVYGAQDLVVSFGGQEIVVNVGENTAAAAASAEEAAASALEASGYEADVIAAGAAQIALVEAEGDTQVGLVTTAGTTATDQAVIATAAANISEANALSETVILMAGDTSWTVPPDFASIISIEALGEGGHGGHSDYAAPFTGGGGGGGAYAALTTLANAVPGDALSVQIGSGGENKPTWIKDNTGAIVLRADHGRNAVGSVAGAGGLTANSTGTNLRAGGSGGAGTTTGGTRGGGGGGGAASSAGDGVNGTAAAATTTGAGAGGASGSGLAGAAALGAGNPGAAGGVGVEWENSARRKIGSGSGAAGANSQSAGGNGGDFGAGGSGAGKVAGSSFRAGGFGAAGIIRIRYRKVNLELTGPFAIVSYEGQSNGPGRAAFDGSEASHPLVHQYVNFSGSGGLINAYPPGFSVADYQTISANTQYFSWPEGYVASGQYGHAYAFSRHMAEALGQPVLIVPNNYGGTGIAVWEPPSGARYTYAVAATNAAITEAQDIVPESYLACRVISQGESDTATAQATYQTRLEDWIDSGRTDMTGGANVAVVILGLSPEKIRINCRHVDIGHRRMPFLKSRCMFAPSRNGHSASDNLHLTRFGTDMAGRDLAVAFNKVDRPEIVHDFEIDSVAEVHPIGTTDIGNVATPLVADVATVAMAGALRRYLTAAGTINTTQFMQAMIECYDPAITNQVVEWIDCFNSTGGVQGVTLRAQVGDCAVSGTSWGRQGYQLLIDHNAGTWTLDRLDASARTVLASGSLAAVAGRYWRIAAIGTTISAAYSADGDTWTSAGSATDATYAAGQAAVGMFNGSTAGQSAFDRIACRVAV